MSTITTRSGKGSPLTNAEVDTNFTNLNTDKVEVTGAPSGGQAIVRNSANTAWVSTTLNDPVAMSLVFGG